VEKHCSLFHLQEVKTSIAGKIMAKKLPKPVEKAPVCVPEPEPEPDSESEPESVKEEKLSPEPILVNLILAFKECFFSLISV
jgi:hypothetical protein